jgi:hypothetical protein
MRHEDIQTTMRYYVDLDVDEMADELWASYPAAEGTTPRSGNKSGNIPAEGDRGMNLVENVSDHQDTGYGMMADGN